MIIFRIGNPMFKSPGKQALPHLELLDILVFIKCAFSGLMSDCGIVGVGFYCRFWLIQWYFFQNPTGWIVSNGVGFVLLFSFVASTLVQRTVLKPHKGYCSFWPPIMFNPNPRPRLIRMIWALFDIN